jgi:predicted DNA-binding ribbon-helix-helix protein
MKPALEPHVTLTANRPGGWQLSVYLLAQDHDLLHRMAAARGVTVAALVRDILRDAMRAEDSK